MASSISFKGQNQNRGLDIFLSTSNFVFMGEETIFAYGQTNEGENIRCQKGNYKKQ